MEAWKFTRNTLIGMLFVSIVASVAHAWLAESEISLALRVPGGVLWPLLTYRAIEIIVRTKWEAGWTHYMVRALVLVPAVPAVIVSYSHQRSLLVMMGETGVVPILGPIAIDGLTIGCTLALLFTRTVETPEPRNPFEAALDAFTLSAPAPEPEPEPEAPRVESYHRDVRLRRAVEALQAGMTSAEAADFSTLSVPYVRNYAAVVRLLVASPDATLPEAMAKRVKPDVVESIREWARELEASKP